MPRSTVQPSAASRTNRSQSACTPMRRNLGSWQRRPVSMLSDRCLCGQHAVQRMPDIFRTITRLLQLMFLLARYQLPARLLLRSNSQRSARALRVVFERLDLTFVKLGQALALRFDLLPADYCQEFLQITNELVAEEYRAISRTVVEDLGRSPDEIFASFEHEPFAVTSSGQLHRATSAAGVRLVVKVQNQATRKKYATDIR